MARIRAQIFGRSEMSKPKLRERLRTLTFSEKVKILEKLRDRDKAIASSGLRRKPADRGSNPGR
jgi:hypothetical protein